MLKRTMLDNKTKIEAYFQGRLSAIDENELFLWLKKDKANRAIFDAEKQKLSGYDKTNVFVESSLAELKSKIYFNSIFQENTKYSKPNRFAKILRVAALVTLLIGIGYTSSFIIQSDFFKKEEIAWFEVTAPPGNKSLLNLPDGTIVWLNAETSIKYPTDFAEGDRNVVLNGEAYFEVAKNNEKTFTVQTKDYGVRVLGTKFNVKAYQSDNEIVTTLEEGSIQIVSTENLKLAEEIILKPNEQVILNRESKKIAVKNVNPKWFTSWKNNKLIFVNMDMKELVVVLERKYGVDIEVKEEALLDLHFDGTIKDETLLEILDVLKKTLPINYHIVGQKIEITTN